MERNIEVIRALLRTVQKASLTADNNLIGDDLFLPEQDNRQEVRYHLSLLIKQKLLAGEIDGEAIELTSEQVNTLSHADSAEPGVMPNIQRISVSGITSEGREYLAEISNAWYLDMVQGQGDNPPTFTFDTDDVFDGIFYSLPDNLIPESKWPVGITQTSNHETLPDFGIGPFTNVTMVSKAFRAIIEEFEPRVHCFVPVRLTRPDGSVEDDSYFIFDIARWTDGALIVEKSSVDSRTVRGKHRGYQCNSLQPRLMWKESTVGQLDVWSDRQLLGVLMISDRLYKTLLARNMKGLFAMESRME